MPRMTLELHQQIDAKLLAGDPRKSIAVAFGVRLEIVDKVAKRGYRNLEGSSSSTKRAVSIFGKRGKGGLSSHADPTPDEIEAACRAIRMARPEPEPEPWLCPGWQYGGAATC